MMIRYTRFLFILVMIGSFCSCKKVKDKLDSEKPFQIYFADSSGNLKNYCYDRVYGIGGANVIPCSAGTFGIKLPLSLIQETSVFLFVKGGVTDTITLDYTKFSRLNGTEYEMFYKLKHPPVNTFGKFSMSCIPQLETYCKSYEGMMGIVYINDEKIKEGKDIKDTTDED